jgi:hypothetical protein
MKNPTQITYSQVEGHNIELNIFPAETGHGEDFRAKDEFRVHRLNENDISDGDLVTVVCYGFNVTKSGRLRKPITDRIREVIDSKLDDSMTKILIQTIESYIK